MDDWLIAIIKVVGIWVWVLLIAVVMTWVERRGAALIQDRPGPNRAGPWGLFQPLADGIKLFTKEEIIPTKAQKFLYIMGPLLIFSSGLFSICGRALWRQDCSWRQGDNTPGLRRKYRVSLHISHWFHGQYMG